VALNLRSAEHRNGWAQEVSNSKMSRMLTRIFETQPVILALMLAGCPTGLDELGGQGELGGEGEFDGDGEPDEDGEPDKDERALELWIGNCHVHDSWEPNPTADQPSLVTWGWVDGWTAYHQIDDVGLCAGEDDWYRYDVENLGYVEHYLYIRALVENAGLCGSDCGQPELVPGPEHAMTIEVYRAYYMQLLTSATHNGGVLVINGPGGEAYAHDLLIRVFSHTSAEYPYRLSVEIRNYDGEDECEC
jgi:hypothetical protein